jgi:putative methyltransferase (TIGR04325 family)
MHRLLTAIRDRFAMPTGMIDGYEHAELVEVVFQKTKAYRPDKPWPALAEASTVLDFGGGCGIHYKQANSPTVRWAVVETPAMVTRARELATDRLQFFTDISEAQRWLGDVDVMHSNGALQYSNDPVGVLKQLCAVKANTMLWTRLRLSEGTIERELQSSRLRDNGPGEITVEDKIVRYEMTRVPESEFLAAHASYELAERGKDWFHFLLAA